MLHLPAKRLAPASLRFLVLEDNEEDLKGRWLEEIQKFANHVGIKCEVLWQMRPVDMFTVRPKGGVWKLTEYEVVCWYDVSPGVPPTRHEFENEFEPFSSFDRFLLDNRMSDDDTPQPIELEDGRTRLVEKLGQDYAAHIQEYLGPNRDDLIALWTSRDVDQIAQRRLPVGVKATDYDLLNELLRWYDSRFPSIIDRVAVWQPDALVTLPQTRVEEIFAEFDGGGAFFRLESKPVPEVKDLRYARALIVIVQKLNTEVASILEELAKRLLCPIAVFYVEFACKKSALGQSVFLFSLPYDDSLAKLKVVARGLTVCPVVAAALDGTSAWKPAIRAAVRAADSEQHVRVEGRSGSGKRTLMKYLKALPRPRDPLDRPDIPAPQADHGIDASLRFTKPEAIARRAAEKNVKLSPEFQKALWSFNWSQTHSDGRFALEAIERAAARAIADSSPDGAFATLWDFGVEALAQLLTVEGTACDDPRLPLLPPDKLREQLLTASHAGRLIVPWLHRRHASGYDDARDLWELIGPMMVISPPQLDQISASDFEELVYYRLRGGKNAHPFDSPASPSASRHSVFLDVEPNVLQVLKNAPWHEHNGIAGLVSHLASWAHDVHIARGPDATITLSDLVGLPVRSESAGLTVLAGGQDVSVTETGNSRLADRLRGREKEVAAVVESLLSEDFGRALSAGFNTDRDFLKATGGMCLDKMVDLLARIDVATGPETVKDAVLTLYCVMGSHGGVTRKRDRSLLNLLDEVLFKGVAYGPRESWSSAFDLLALVQGGRADTPESRAQRRSSEGQSALVFNMCAESLKDRFKDRCKTI